MPTRDRTSLGASLPFSSTPIRVSAPKAIAKALVGWIVQIQPHEPPVQSNVYRDLKKDLEHIEQAGVAVGWTSLPDTQDLRLPTMDLLEAVRLYESTKEGFGKFPDQISKLLMATGLVWICVHPARRSIPDF